MVIIPIDLAKNRKETKKEITKALLVCVPQPSHLHAARALPRFSVSHAHTCVFFFVSEEIAFLAFLPPALYGL